MYIKPLYCLCQVDFVDSPSVSELCFRTVADNGAKYVVVAASAENRFYEIRSTGPECTNVIIEEILIK